MILVHPERMPTLGPGQIYGSSALVEVNGALVPVQDAEVAAAAVQVQSGLGKQNCRN